MATLGKTITNPSTGEQYHDGKRYLWTLSILYPLLPTIFIALTFTTGQLGWLWAMPAFYFIAVPIIDYFLGEDTNNPPEWAVPELEEDRFYRVLTWLTVPVHFVTLAVGAWAFAHYYAAGAPAWALIGLVLSIAYAAGIAVNTGHELGHKKTALEQWMAKLVLAITAYGHFKVEHNRGHHVHVATPEDAASARMGENFFQFALGREIPGAIKRAWELERDRMHREGRGAFNLRNEVLHSWLLTAAIFGVLTAAFGWIVLPFLFAQALLGGYMQLSLANFVEHYGLLRQKKPNGRYEPCQPEHSWNTNHIFSNLLSFHLQRHSDHHAYATRRYQSLRHFEGLPSLPSGYPGMFLLAQIPPLWRKVMDKRLLEHYGYDMNRVNVDPRKREKLFAKYHQPRANG